MKHEMERRRRLSSDIFADANGAKLIFTLLAKKCNENCLQGYIQKIDYDPFGLLMICDMQVKFVFDFNHFPQWHYALKFYRKNMVTLSLVSVSI